MLKNKFFIAFLGVLIAVSLQEYNLSSYKFQFPYNHGLLSSADEASYLRPPQNLIEIGEWKDNSNSITAYFQRPPGYGLLFLFLKVIYPSNPWVLLKTIQICAFFISILLFYNILLNLNKSVKSTVIFTYIYALTPCFSGFIYFTITEGISPFFLLITCYSWIKLLETQNKFNTIFYIFSATIFLLIRPQLLVFVLLFQIIFLFHIKFKHFLLTCSLFLPILIWNIRTTVINGSFPGLHPIYSYQNNGLYRPSHEKLTNLYRIWEHQSDIFHTSVGFVAYDTSSVALQNSLALVPLKFHPDVKRILKEFQLLWQYHREHFPATKKIKGAFKKEIAFEIEVEKLRWKLIKKNPFDYYVKTPFNSFKELIISSHLNLKIFQADWRGNTIVELMRWFCLVLIISIVLISVPSLFYYKTKVVFALGLSIFLYVFYLVYVQRLNEERYLTPILPIGFLLLGFFVSKWKTNILYYKKSIN